MSKIGYDTDHHEAIRTLDASELDAVTGGSGLDPMGLINQVKQQVQQPASELKTITILGFTIRDTRP